MADEIGFPPTMVCPVCGALDHKVYTYRGLPLLVCPKVPEGKFVTPEDYCGLDPKGNKGRPHDECGLDPLTTGDWDPYQESSCNPHGGDYSDMIDGKPHPSIWEINGDWIVNTTKTALKGAYAVATYPLYLIGGLVAGTFRWGQWQRRGKDKENQ